MSSQGQSLLVEISLQIRVITSFFQVFRSVYFKGHSPRNLQNGIFCTWAGLFIFLARELPSIYLLYSVWLFSYIQDLTNQILDPL